MDMFREYCHQIISYLPSIVILFSVLFLMIAYLTFKLRESSFRSKDRITALHLQIRNLLFLNQKIVNQLRSEGNSPPMSPTEYLPPLLFDDVKKTGEKIADEEKKEREKDKKEDHTQQLLRTLEDLKFLYELSRDLGETAGMNFVIMLISIIAALVGLLAIPVTDGLSIVLTIVALLICILDFIKKMKDNATDEKVKARIKKLEDEVEEKRRKMS